MDYMTDKSRKDRHDYDSQFKGSNRFATVLLYMSDMEPGEGGETLFSKSYPPEVPEADRLDVGEAIKELRASGDATMLTEGSWQEKMVATCRSKFSVRPRSAKAVLFYSQLPNGREDPMSMHGGCPVLNPDKVSFVRSCVHVCYG
jgi:prolyl 4-hydroxylase